MIRMFKARRLTAVVLGGLLGLSACSKDSTTPTTTSPTPVAAAASITETFASPIAVGGSVFYSFNFAAYGNVSVTLSKATGGGLDEGQTLSLGIGRPGGTSCNPAQTVSAVPGDTAQLTGVYGPGVYCVRVTDTGSLTGPVTVAVTVFHS